MELANRDNKIMTLKKHIEQKQNMLLSKYKDMKQLSNENDFLKLVVNDYDKYYKFIIKNKQDQLKSLEIVHEYLDNINKNTEQADAILNDSHKEQKLLMIKINKLRQELDEIMT